MRGHTAVIWPERPPALDWRAEIERRGDPIRYRVYMEPSDRHWLFTLPAAQSASARPTIGLVRTNLLVHRTPITQPISFDVETWPSYRHQAVGLSPEVSRENLAYPRGANPRTEGLVEGWLQSGTQDEIPGRILAWFNQAFTYTLEPPLYPGAAVDQFLFDGQRGFCEHFASAAALMLRIAGIPARIVAGYQGGEVHPGQGYLMVHQYNAHAWVEFWWPGRGWVQLDPTAAVAPERIELGFQDFFADSGARFANPLALENWRDIAALNWLRLQLDGINYRWLSWVLGYDSDQQFAFLEGLLGRVSPLRLALFVVSLVVLPWLSYLLWAKVLVFSRQTPEQRLLRAYLQFARDQGVAVTPATTLRHVRAALIERRPDLADSIGDLSNRLEQQFYGDGAGDSGTAEALRRLRRRRSPSRLS
jgi:hypothetical protein